MVDAVVPHTLRNEMCVLNAKDILGVHNVHNEYLFHSHVVVVVAAAVVVVVDNNSFAQYRDECFLLACVGYAGYAVEAGLSEEDYNWFFDRQCYFEDIQLVLVDFEDMKDNLLL